MKKINIKIKFLLTIFYLLFFTQFARANSEEKAAALISSNAELICRFAHPTASFKGGQSSTNITESGKIIITTRFDYYDLFGYKGSTRINFHFNKWGNLERIGDAENNAFLLATFGVASFILIAESDEEFKESLKEDPVARATWKAIRNNSDPKELLTFILKICQA